jgi:hypothetical protein
MFADGQVELVRIRAEDPAQKRGPRGKCGHQPGAHDPKTGKCLAKKCPCLGCETVANAVNPAPPVRNYYVTRSR